MIVDMVASKKREGENKREICKEILSDPSRSF